MGWTSFERVWYLSRRLSGERTAPNQRMRLSRGGGHSWRKGTRD